MLCLVAQSCPTLRLHGLSPPGYSVHGDSPGKNTGVGCLALLQGIFPTQGSNIHLLCQLYLYTYLLLFSLHPTTPFYSLGHYRAASRAPCAVQQFLTSFPFRTWLCINVAATLPIRSTLTFSPCVHMSTICVSLYSCPANSFISTIFLDSIYMCSYILFFRDLG